jgi:hypothetical protein
MSTVKQKHETKSSKAHQVLKNNEQISFLSRQTQEIPRAMVLRAKSKRVTSFSLEKPFLYKLKQSKKQSRRLIAETEQKSVLLKRVFFILTLDSVTESFFHNHDMNRATNRSRWRKPDKPCKKTGFTLMKNVRKVMALCARKWKEKTNDILYLNC